MGMFKQSVALKAVVVGGIVLVLLIPLGTLRGLVDERAAMRSAAHDKVAQSWGGRVSAPGPILAVPAERDVLRDGKPAIENTEIYFLPDKLRYAVSLRMQPQPRRVGIYAVPVYLAEVHMTGELGASVIQRWERAQPRYRLQWTAARVVLPMSQTRELRAVEARYGGQLLTFVPANAGQLHGIEAPLSWTAAPTRAVHFDGRLLLAGSGGFSFLPLGSDTHVRMAADWPHPSFDGAFAPTRYTIDAQRFAAEWTVLELNRGYGQALFASELPIETLLESATGVDIFQSVDIYQRGERAIKYALVFIALTFLTFFAWEQVSDVRLHPLQYLLVGLALSVFYLLLLAFTEHIAFAAAYAIAALALVGLIGAYFGGATGSLRRGGAVALALTSTYGVLYVLVLSEDYALLLGALAVFAALSAVMWATRKIDWYARTDA